MFSRYLPCVTVVVVVISVVVVVVIVVVVIVFHLCPTRMVIRRKRRIKGERPNRTGRTNGKTKVDLDKKVRTSTLEVSLDFKFLISFNLDTLGHLSIGVALVLASFIVIVVVVAVAVFTDVFASLLKSVHLVLSPGIQELHHVDHVVSTSLALIATGVTWAKRELDKILGVKQTLLIIGLVGNLDQTAASTVFDGVVGDEGHIALFVKGTSLGQEALSKLGSGLDIKVGDDSVVTGTDLGGKKGQKKRSGADEHFFAG